MLDVGDTISQAQSVFTPLQHIRAAEQEERLHVLCGVRVRACVWCVCVYVYGLGSARGADESARKINVQQHRHRSMCVLVHLGCDQPLPQKSALRCGHF